MMTLLEHLRELRDHAVRIAIALVVCSAAAFVARLGVVTSRQMLSVWRFALVGIAVLAAFITPTADWLNMTLVMGPLIALYFFGIFLARLARPKGTAQAMAT
jgi:sec-independent protein translocase protein TatC